MHPSSASPPATPSPAPVTGALFSRGKWVPLLWWVDYCGWPGQPCWSLSSELPRPVLCRCCRLLVDRAGSGGSWLKKSQGPGVSTTSLVGRATFWGGCVGLGCPDPVLAYWWMGLFPGRLLWATGCPKAGSGLLVSQPDSHGSWVSSPRYLRAGIGMLVGGTTAQGLLGLMLA